MKSPKRTSLDCKTLDIKSPDEIVILMAKKSLRRLPIHKINVWILKIRGRECSILIHNQYGEMMTNKCVIIREKKSYSRSIIWNNREIMIEIKKIYAILNN